MIMIITLLIVSFFLEGVVTSIISDFIPFFSLSIIIFSCFFIKDKKTYYIIVILYGLIYDLSYYPTFFVNSFLFFIISFLSYNFIKNKFNIYILCLFYFVIINIYCIFLFLIFYNNINYSVYYLIKKIISSLIINYLYFLILFLICVLLKKYKKMHINKLGDSFDR